MTAELKKTLAIISGIILVFLVGYTITITSFYLNQKKEKERIETNFNNSQFKLDSVRNKNGELQYSVKALSLKNTEFVDFNSDLTKQIADMGIKIKNLEAVTKVSIQYVYDIDTVKIEKKSPNIFIGRYSDVWLTLSERIALINNNTDIKVDSLKLNLKDDLLMPYEVEYSGWWFWKKAKNIKVWVKSQNPHFTINKMESYQLIK